MATSNKSLLRLGVLAALPLCLLFAASCSKTEDTAPPPGETTMSAPGNMPGRGGPGGLGGGQRGGPIAANATGADLYQASCRCHGANGAGGNAPALTASASRADADLYKIIHDGHQKMPAFGTRLSEEQINKVVAHIKQFSTKA